MIALRKKNSIVIAIIVSVLFFGIRWSIVRGPGVVDRGLSYCLYPFLKLQQTLVMPIKNMLERRRSYNDLEQNLAQVMADREALLAKVVTLESSLNFMQDTQELITFQRRYGHDQQGTVGLLAHVLMRQTSDQSHFILVDVGSRHGITADMIAVYKNCLIGRVSEVYPNYSKIVLITDRACKVAAYCSSTKACGIHEGINNTLMTKLSFVSHLQALQMDDLVLSSGEGLLFPRGFGLGYVKHFQSDGVHHTVSIAPLIDIRTISYCYVLRKGDISQKEPETSAI
jgi:rod shape-determining protein MreC